MALVVINGGVGRRYVLGRDHGSGGDEVVVVADGMSSEGIMALVVRKTDDKAVWQTGTCVVCNR